MISPDDVQSPYAHGQGLTHALEVLGTIWLCVLAISWYIEAANRARLADKRKKKTPRP